MKSYFVAYVFNSWNGKGWQPGEIVLDEHPVYWLTRRRKNESGPSWAIVYYAEIDREVRDVAAAAGFCGRKVDAEVV